MKDESPRPPLTIVDDGYQAWLWLDERVAQFPMLARRMLGQRIVTAALDALVATVEASVIRGPARARRSRLDRRGLRRARQHRRRPTFDEVPETRTIDLTVDGERVFRIVMLHIAVYGPRLRPEARKLAKLASADLIVCGHSHVPFGARDGGVSGFNPGSIGPRRFHLPIVFGVLPFSMSGIRLKHVDCETGLDWTLHHSRSTSVGSVSRSNE